jgi:plasmid maintenance system antidote protein VapI
MDGLDVRKALSGLLNGHSGASAAMSIRLEKAGWSTADHRPRMRMHHDLWHARQRAAGTRAKPFSPASAA